MKILINIRTVNQKIKHNTFGMKSIKSVVLVFAWTTFVREFAATPVRSGDSRALQKEKVNCSEVAPKASLDVKKNSGPHTLLQSQTESRQEATRSHQASGEEHLRERT